MAENEFLKFCTNLGCEFFFIIYIKFKQHEGWKLGKIILTKFLFWFLWGSKKAPKWANNVVCFFQFYCKLKHFLCIKLLAASWSLKIAFKNCFLLWKILFGCFLQKLSLSLVVISWNYVFTCFIFVELLIKITPGQLEGLAESYFSLI